MSKGRGMIPGAPPTAPGGMSRKALVEELRLKHEWTTKEAVALSKDWPALIDTVILERKAREQEAKAEGILDELAETTSYVTRVEEPNMFEESATSSSDLDNDGLDDLLDEYDQREDAGFDAPHPDEQAPSLFLGMPGTMDYTFDGHAGAGPSGAERWMNCTASLGASRKFLETLTLNQQREFAAGSEAAHQGTTAHAAAEAEANHMLGRIEGETLDATLLELSIEPDSGEEYNDEMAGYITEYTDLVKQYIDSRGDERILIEARVEAAIPLMTVDADGDPNVYEIKGSADFIALPTKDEPVLTVGDLKYGEGLDVDVEHNPQIRIYALGALGLLTDDDGELITDVDEIEYYIIQPRLGGIKRWTESVDDLLDWRDDVLSKALTEALGGLKAGASFVPGELQCQWCPVRGSCSALAEQRVESAAGLFDMIIEGEHTGEGFPETGTLTDAQLGDLLTQATGLIKLGKDLKEEMQRRLYRGDSVPGWQLVNYSPPRKWKDGAAEQLDQREDLWQHKLVTPTAAEKLLGEEYASVEALIIKPDKVPVVAPEGDRRSKWEGKAPEAMFDVEGDE